MSPVPEWSHYLQASSVLRDSGLTCRGVGEQGPRQRMAPRRLSIHGLLFLTEGRGLYRGEASEPVELVAPAVVWLFPGVQHDYNARSQDVTRSSSGERDPAGADWREHWILFEGTAVRGYEALQAWRREQPVRSATADLAAQIAPLFAALRDSTATPGRQADLVAATLSHALIGVAAVQTERQAESHRRGGQESLVDVVVRTALSPGSVADRAGEVGRTPDQLRQEVRAQTGLSVHELVIRTRVDRAQSLLATTTMAVADVARQVGYDDPAYFSRVFSARVGVPPTVFREETSR